MSGQPSRHDKPPGEWSDNRVECVLRRCEVCDWEGEVIERPGTSTDCPWCHGPTDWHATIASSRNIAEMVGEKNPHAAMLGRLGGLKGGPARAEALTATERRRIARRAARARWNRKKSKTPL
jgi:pyruvate-formate lyase-activating enzyme